ncbi:uncharacterized protein B0I36DRAFT_336013 [Microdochium trichocladiopsis]|uniref:Uncharacterized protein n=1 Tax=Microdochium trichocladiopsis TaxID=1682393 RepID=A0A9P8XUQ1_9PEZI|nr:uncharacterized protein B0I36DRAFT_336013 [Microdochium trichocladiopsis]KAH7018472.1 hypothetical protein B0I36DRAFT_336013 [Microdochium trichocladiopsis]
MKFFAVLALATAAIAAPSDVTLNARHPQCTPPQYACKPDASGWLVCNVDGTWLNGGVCPLKTTCKPINNLPYCV